MENAKPFNLHSVLKHRQRLKEQAQDRFTAARTALESVEERYNEAEEELRRLFAEIEVKQREGVAITTLIHYQAHAAQLENNLDAIGKNRDEKRYLVEQMRENLIDKSRQKQVLERLQEKKDRAFALYQQKKESAMLDEIAVMRHSRNSPIENS